MKKLFFVGMLVLLSCSEGSTNKEGNLLSPEKMAQVMTEVHILEARISKLYLKEDSSVKLYNHYEGLLLDSLHVPKQDFEASLEYYFDNSKDFEKIYNVVVDTLLARQKTTKD